MLNLAIFCEKKYYDFQNKYVYSVVHTTYTRQWEVVVEYLRGSQLHLSGDGRCDSPGYSAKYCTYTLMDSATDLILDYSLLQCTDTTSSVTMEKKDCNSALIS